MIPPTLGGYGRARLGCLSNQAQQVTHHSVGVMMSFHELPRRLAKPVPEGGVGYREPQILDHRVGVGTEHRYVGNTMSAIKIGAYVGQNTLTQGHGLDGEEPVP